MTPSPKQAKAALDDLKRIGHHAPAGRLYYYSDYFSDHLETIRACLQAAVEGK